MDAADEEVDPEIPFGRGVSVAPDLEDGAGEVGRTTDPRIVARVIAI